MSSNTPTAPTVNGLHSGNFPGRNFPLITVFGVTLLLGLLAYSSAAFILFGAWCLALGVLWCVLNAGALWGESKRQFSSLGVPLLFATLLLAYWLFSTWRAPYLPTATRDLAGIYPGLLAFVATLFWFLNAKNASVDATRLGTLICFSLLVLLALSGYYQTYGTAAMPGTFANKEASILLNKEFFSPLEYESLLHLVREGRTSGWVGSSNIFAGFLVLALPLGVGILASKERMQIRLFGGLGILICFGAIILSGSRGAAVSGAFFLLLTVALLPVRNRLLFCSKPAAGVLFLMINLPSFLHAQSSIFTRPLGLSTLQQRFYYWEAAWSMFLDSPIIGNGLGSFEVLYPMHRVLSSQETRQAHSILFESLAEFGVLGTLLFAVSLLWVIISVLNSKEKQNHPYTLFLFLSLGSGLFHGLIEYTFTQPEFTIIWGLLLGLFLSQRGEAAEAQNGVQQKRHLLLTQACSVLLLCGFCVAWWSGNFIPGMVDERVRAAEGAQSEGDFGKAYGLLTQAAKWEPTNATLYARRASLSNALRQDPGPDLIRAQEANPYSAANVDSYGQYLLAKGDLAEGTKALEKAHAMHPLDATHAMNLAELYLKQNRTDEAKALLANIWKIKRSVEEDHRLPMFQELLPEKETQ